MEGRNARQIRERYLNYLDDQLEKQLWTTEEDERLLSLTKTQPISWKQLRQYFPGRTDVHLKNRFARLRKEKEKKSKNKIFESLQKEDVPQIEFLDEIEFDSKISGGNFLEFDENWITFLESISKHCGEDFFVI
jgi:hypothetical protein